MLIEHNRSVDDRTFASIFNSTRFRLTSNHIQARLLDPFFEEKAASAIYIGARNDDIVVQKNKITSAGGNGIDVTHRMHSTGLSTRDHSANAIQAEKLSWLLPKYKVAHIFPNHSLGSLRATVHRACYRLEMTQEYRI